ATFFTAIEGADAYRAGKQPGVVGIQATDETHLVFQLKQPSSVFLYQLAMTFAAPVPREVVKTQGDRFADHVVGAGPYRLEKWERGRAIDLARMHRDPPHPAHIHVDLGIPETTQLTRFNTGALDVTSGIPPPEIPRLLADPSKTGVLAKAVVNQTWYLGM